MRFATCEFEGQPRAAVVDDAVLRLFPAGVRVLDLVRQGLPAALAQGRALGAGEPVAADSVRLLPPLEPPTIRDFVAFQEHVEGVVRSVEGRKQDEGVGGVAPEWFELPTFYFGNPYALIGAHDDVAVPPGCSVLDFELEVAAVIGSGARNVAPAEAAATIFGYTIFNDWSARDLQRREMRVGLGPAKGKDFASTLGPWIVTADELADAVDDEGYLGLRLTVSVNDAPVGEDLLSNMGWTFPELVAYASRGTEVRPGDVLGSGTCGNGGSLAELWGRNGTQAPPPLAVGDVVELTVEGIGSVRNRVVAGQTAHPIPPARERPRNRFRGTPA